MNTLFKVLMALTVIGLALGFSDVGSGMFSGFCRALGAVFFALAFITRLVHNAETEAAS